MRREHDAIFARLAAKFASTAEKTFKKGNTPITYVTARVVMNRLDDVLGPANWWDDYTPLEHSVICRLTLRLPDGSTVTKMDAGAYAGMSDQGDDDKSGFSDAFKRAAVKFGIGRYLYNDGRPKFVDETLAELKAKAGSRQDATAATDDAPPVTGSDLISWLKGMSQRDGQDYYGPAVSYGKACGWPVRMIDWDAEQVAATVSGVLGVEEPAHAV